MSLITSFIIATLSWYLAVTNALAEHIADFLPVPTSSTVTVATAPATLPQLPSEYEAIPHILIEHTPPQTAAVGDAFDSNTYTSNPEEAIVNIFCTYLEGNTKRAVTGTGFFIDSDGVILTNAHVAQFLILEHLLGDADCTIRTGSPAVAAYEVSLLYISPAWVLKHAALINDDAPQGTGERDFALLYVTDGLNHQPIPRHFPALAINQVSPHLELLGQTVRVAGYPAETAFAQGNADAPLLPRVGTTTVADLMTFGDNTGDIMTIRGSAVGEQGSSGGPIVNKNGEAIGLISTRGDDAVYGGGSLRALTLSYVARTYEAETNRPLTSALAGDLPSQAHFFARALVPVLENLLAAELSD